MQMRAALHKKYPTRVGQGLPMTRGEETENGARGWQGPSAGERSGGPSQTSPWPGNAVSCFPPLLMRKRVVLHLDDKRGGVSACALVPDVAGASWGGMSMKWTVEETAPLCRYRSSSLPDEPPVTPCRRGDVTALPRFCMSPHPSVRSLRHVVSVC